MFRSILMPLLAVPSSGSRKRTPGASSEERILLKPEEVKWKCTKEE
jgi:hypothetical protein